MDPARLDQIVLSLTQNALHYGRAPFAIDANAREGIVEVWFRDKGPGIARDQQEHLFEPFRLKGEHGSVGFGLVVARMMAQASGGSLVYVPEAATGACLRLVLPPFAAGSANPDPGDQRPSSVPPVPQAAVIAAMSSDPQLARAPTTPG